MRQGKNPYVIEELDTGFAVLAEYQYFYGYSLFFCKQHARELHDLDPAFRVRFLEEMAQLAEAVFQVVQPHKLNYESLGNVDPHLHWHVFPRHSDEPGLKAPVWVVDPSVSQAPNRRIAEPELSDLKQKIREALLSIRSR